MASSLTGVTLTIDYLDSEGNIIDLPEEIGFNAQIEDFLEQVQITWVMGGMPSLQIDLVPPIDIGKKILSSNVFTMDEDHYWRVRWRYYDEPEGPRGRPIPVFWGMHKPPNMTLSEDFLSISVQPAPSTGIMSFERRKKWPKSMSPKQIVETIMESHGYEVVLMTDIRDVPEGFRQPIRDNEKNYRTGTIRPFWLQQGVDFEYADRILALFDMDLYRDSSQEDMKRAVIRKRSEAMRDSPVARLYYRDVPKGSYSTEEKDISDENRNTEQVTSTSNILMMEFSTAGQSFAFFDMDRRMRKIGYDKEKKEKTNKVASGSESDDLNSFDDVVFSKTTSLLSGKKEETGRSGPDLMAEKTKSPETDIKSNYGSVVPSESKAKQKGEEFQQVRESHEGIGNINADATTIGIPWIRPTDLVRLKTSIDMFDGIYIVKEITHTVAGEATTELSLMRNSVRTVRNENKSEKDINDKEPEKGDKFQANETKIDAANNNLGGGTGLA